MLSKNNIWRFKVLGGDGKSVKTAEDMTTLTMRGPGTKAALIESATILLTSKRADAINAGLDDPGYKIDESSIEPLGHTDAEVGKWKLPGGKTLDLPTDATVREQDRALIQEKLNLTGENA